MNLRTTLELRPPLEMQAGGPGSGRHPGGGSGFKSVWDYKRPDAAHGDAKAAVLDRLEKIKKIVQSSDSSKAGWGDAGTMAHVHEALGDVHNFLGGYD